MAFHWTLAGGIAPLEHLPEAVTAVEAHAVSSNGEVIVGEVWYRSNRSAAFRWTSKGFIELGALPGDTKSRACAVSADGSVVVGSSGCSDTEAFRWTQETGIVGLGTLPGGSRNSAAFAVSDDGSTIVGQSHSEFGLEAFVWDATHGMRSVCQLLSSKTDPDTSLRSWKLRSATAVSRDGSVIVGSGINPNGDREAWIARLGDKLSSDEPAL
jgi:probable HAF family extracellular repeat protein